MEDGLGSVKLVRRLGRARCQRPAFVYITDEVGLSNMQKPSGLNPEGLYEWLEGIHLFQL